ncbi:CehA/McbA family metallohydrolase [Wenzhouxiangella sp. XN79A]|uniref:CehA/McbA family metallohydrolase n=1 Tax=Wenzhouxiangella sp. XN79A TaxID=2724193 RepID=UPI00144ABD35|nr:CehA/McbA family metallohydrolase [Wenzhouxiangella sp. XN79A]NKI36365.1 CehA/McbA family metallohydrolase [Wenzhouxiangella sp. XN79A]
MSRSTMIRVAWIPMMICTFATGTLHAQWNNRYAKLDDFGHHVYLEQHELPLLAHGPVDPAPAPDGRTLAFAARGWLWVLDLDSGVATRITDGPNVDGRPRWSPDGTRLAFVRDDGSDTAVVVRDLATGREQVIDTPAIELDPEFSIDGNDLFYTSGESGSLQLRQRHLASGVERSLTDLDQVVRNARRLPDASGLLYLHGAGAHRVLRERDFIAGSDRIVHAETLTYHLTADVHPVERLIVYSAPIDNDYHLWTLDLDDPRVRHRLTDGHAYATTPAFSADGHTVFFVDLDDRRQFRLMRIPTYGGQPEPVRIDRWDYGTATAALEINIRDADANPLTARVSVREASGRPVAFHEDATYFDPQTGRHYFYVEGRTRLTLPAGRYTVTATRGPMTPIVVQDVRVRAGRDASVVLEPAPIWDAHAAGYVSADHHVHLNGDGHHRADHDHALRAMAGEDLDQLAPQSWNRWERRIDRSILGQNTERDGRIVHQAQEVRSHFHGHIGLIGVVEPFAPWFFGPNNPTLGSPDLTNGDVIAFAEKHGAFPTYVHPIGSDRDPFEHLEDGPIPVELISDGVLAERIGLELVCAWTSPLGNAQVWYRLLNIGRPVAAMSGTDGWIDFHRTPAPGTARTYVRVDPAEATVESVIEAAAAGRSFLTTGPALLFELAEGARPGDVTRSGRQQWTATLASTNDIDVVEILVNGTVVERVEGVAAGQTRRITGEVRLPAGGWVAARAYASEPPADPWPTMHARPFAHSSPIWIGEIGSTDPAARSAAAADLIRAVDAAAATARAAYGEVETPRLDARFLAARARLAGMIDSGIEGR